MILNISEYVKNSFFSSFDFWDKNIAIISDSKIEVDNFYEFDVVEPVWQILALAEKYDFVFAVLDRINWDNIYRLYKNNVDNVCVINLNAGYTGLWKKIILADLDDIYIKPNVDVYEPMDVENFKFFVEKFLNDKKICHIRVPNKEVEEKIWNNEINLEYGQILDFSEFWIQWYNGWVICYGSMLQETLNAVWLLQSEWIWVDLFWIWNYKQDFSVDLLKRFESQEKIFVIWDFDAIMFRDYLYSKFCEFEIWEKEIHFITPENTNKQVINEFLWESTWMDPVKIYERIRKFIS